MIGAYSRVTGESVVITVDLSQTAAELDGARRLRPPLVRRWRTGKRRAERGRTKVSAYFGYTVPGPDTAGGWSGGTGNRRHPFRITAPRPRSGRRSLDHIVFRRQVREGSLCGVKQPVTVTCGVACPANIVVDFSQIVRVWKNAPRHSAEQCGPAVASALESDRRG